MKSKLFFLTLILSLTLIGCNEVMTCIITSPTPDKDKMITFSENESIPVTVEASTTKGAILQVDISVLDKNDTIEVIKSFLSQPYQFTIQPKTLKPGLHVLTAVAFSSEGNRETDAMYLTIEE